MLRCTEVTEGCAEVHRGVCRGVGRCMEGYDDVQRCMDRCVVVHGGVKRYTEVCAEVCGGNRGMQRCTDSYRGAQMYVEGS